MKTKLIINELKSHSNQETVKGMAKFGINPETALGLGIPFLRNKAKEIGKDHQLARELWESRIHEARILATMIEQPNLVTPSQMDMWTNDFNSWDLCDQCCMNLYIKTDYVHEKILSWYDEEKEFVKRAAFALMAVAAVHKKDWKNEDFLRYFPLIEKASPDERNFVKKAVNWALRQIGKRNAELNSKAIALSEKLSESDSKAAAWTGKNALKELVEKREKKFK